MKTACVTGHRYITNNLINRKAVNHLIDLAITKDGIEHFYVGMSRGADFLFADVLSERKLNWTAIIPCTNQTHLWNESDREFHSQLVNKAEDMIILHEEYKHGVMHYRNQYMVNKSEILLAIYDNSEKGGTFHTVNLAIKQHLKVIQFHPQTYEFNVIKSNQLSLSELISWAEDEIENYQIYIDGELTPDKAMEIINDIGNVTINPNY